MSLLPFENLPGYAPRHFVPEQVDWNQWVQIAPLFDRLVTSAANCSAVFDLEQWLLDWGELNAVIDEESSRRYIAMTCHTDHAGAGKTYLHFVEQIEPHIKARKFKLGEIFPAH